MLCVAGPPWATLGGPYTIQASIRSIPLNCVWSSAIPSAHIMRASEARCASTSPPTYVLTIDSTHYTTEAPNRKPICIEVEKPYQSSKASKMPQERSVARFAPRAPFCAGCGGNSGSTAGALEGPDAARAGGAVLWAGGAVRFASGAASRDGGKTSAISRASIDGAGAGAGAVAATGAAAHLGAATEVDDDTPGCEAAGKRGVCPGDHTQQGSPSSSPLDIPSPSLSARHRARVHLRPSALKARPKVFRPPPPAHDVCPTPLQMPALQPEAPGGQGTAFPFGKRTLKPGSARPPRQRQRKRRTAGMRPILWRERV